MNTVITADEARAMHQRGSAGEEFEKIARFNQEVMMSATASSRLELLLPYSEYGEDRSDVQWIVDAGYRVCGNSACRWWEVSLP